MLTIVTILKSLKTIKFIGKFAFKILTKKPFGLIFQGLCMQCHAFQLNALLFFYQAIFVIIGYFTKKSINFELK